MREDLTKFSGEEYYQKPPQLILNEIAINGKTGDYRYRNILEGLKETKKGNQLIRRYNEENLGSKIDLVFLKIRRKLVHYRKGEKPLVTNEHNYKGDFITLWGDTVEKGIAAELREKYPNLRTQQIVYALYEGELVRIVVKGASLGSQSKGENVLTFYNYISSFKTDKAGNKIDEHFYQYNTILSNVEESSDLGSYFAIDFNKGEKLSEEEMDKVSESMKRVHNYCLEIDEYYNKSQTKEVDTVIREELETIDYGSDIESESEVISKEPKSEKEVNIDDVPF